MCFKQAVKNLIDKNERKSCNFLKVPGQVYDQVYTHNLTNANFLSDLQTDSKYIFVFDNTPWLEALGNNLNYSQEYISDKNRNGFYDLDIDISVKVTYEQTSRHEKVLAFFTILMSFLTVIFAGSLGYYFLKFKEHREKEKLLI